MHRRQIVDKQSKKPDDWDDEEDGECVDCPMKDNPDYKGDRKAKSMSNPERKGVWEANKINNPEYVEDDEIYTFDELCDLSMGVLEMRG